MVSNYFAYVHAGDIFTMKAFVRLNMRPTPGFMRTFHSSQEWNIWSIYNYFDIRVKHWPEDNFYLPATHAGRELSRCGGERMLSSLLVLLIFATCVESRLRSVNKSLEKEELQGRCGKGTTEEQRTRPGCAGMKVSNGTFVQRQKECIMWESAEREGRSEGRARQEMGDEKWSKRKGRGRWTRDYEVLHAKITTLRRRGKADSMCMALSSGQGTVEEMKHQEQKAKSGNGSW